MVGRGTSPRLQPIKIAVRNKNELRRIGATVFIRIGHYMRKKPIVSQSMDNILSIITISDSLAFLIVIESPQTFDLVE